ncbi:hypothetical protein B0A48_02178 [Cryoendolithus antarcticus]|uniref:Enoyl reductase (ER) domain-containing protein n=1 Tax=Cryoendolithus antarcticus TaxID=1507870 RepID=A0A1V8TN29_9PEZI|nr:hypothetical protein B0A48_02178 [Cryoendolithus antarcticus]
MISIAFTGMSTTQKAVLVRRVGQPMDLGERPIPVPGNGEVLVKITATMILPHDAYGRDWGMFEFGNKLPFVVGNNIAGVVEKVGPGVSLVRPGERVFGLSAADEPTPDRAGLQQYALLRDNAIAKTPDGFTDDQVASLPINVVTAWVSLFTSSGFGWPAPFSAGAKSSSTKSFDAKAQSLVIVAAGSNVGKFAVQMASLAGVGKIITVASSSNEDELLQMGATHFFDRHTSLEDIVAKIRAVSGGEGATHILDCFNDDFSLAIALLARDGASHVRTLHPIIDEQAVRFQRETPMADVRFIEDLAVPFGPQAVEFWQHLPEWLQEGKILPTTFRVIEGLEKVNEINAALDHYMNGTRGRQVIVHP